MYDLIGIGNAYGLEFRFVVVVVARVAFGIEFVWGVRVLPFHA